MIKFKDINYPRRKEKEIIINLPNEIWKDVCDGYKVSNYGRVLSLAKTTINSAIRAAIKNNISVSAIYNCLYGKSKTCGGYEWIKR